MVYAAAQQFGMKKGYAGRNSKGRPIPWGDIPARPFLGISDYDKATILDFIAMNLGEYIKP
jgi:phage gpG-like protein